MFRGLRSDNSTDAVTSSELQCIRYMDYTDRMSHSGTHIDLTNKRVRDNAFCCRWRTLPSARYEVQNTLGESCLQGNENENHSSVIDATHITSWKASATIAWLLGENSDDFRTTVLPQMIGIAIALMLRNKGAFHGEIA